MKIEYIGHACLLIDTGKIKIASDPWFNGPAYCGQWHIFPKPVNAAALNQTDVITLSHGHEDHLHVPSLEQIRGNQRVFYPHLWYGGTKEYLQDLGFTKVTEAIPYKSYRLDGATTITYFTNSLDSMIVIESKGEGEVLVNINDALHSSTTDAIDHFIEVIRNKWPRIDYVFCGFGGASYFPNCFHVPGKDDLSIGRLREQIFAHNFCHIVSGLKPRIAVPFAADFALLSPAQRWINDVRFPRSLMKQYYEQNFGGASNCCEIVEMYPGDALENLQLRAASPYRGMMKDGGLGHLIDEQYAEEISALKHPNWLAERRAEELRARILKNVGERAAAISRDKLNRIAFSVRVNDVAESHCYNLSFKGGSARVERSAGPVPKSLLVIDANSRILNYSLDSDWGGEALGIGYGCEIHIAGRETIRANLDRACIQFLHRLPVFKSHIRQAPARAMRALMTEKVMRRRALMALGKLSGEASETLYENHWLIESADQIREAFQLPQFNVGTTNQEQMKATV